jgi:ankyrin repeat protein
VHKDLDSFRYPFLLYAAHTLGFHARQHEGQVLEDLIRFLADKTQARLISLLLLPSEHADSYNQSPLHIIAYFDLPIIAQRLIDGGVDVDSTDSNGRTPLSFAAERGSISVLETLLANKADVNKADKSGDTVLAWAARYNQDKIVERLGDVQSVQLNSRNTSGFTPLCVAASSGHVEIVDTLLRLAATRATVEEGQDTRGGIRSVRNTLLETRTTEGQTALMLGAWNGHDNVVIALLRAGANVNALDNMGFTPISQAAERGEEQVVKILLDNEADANAKDVEGNTPLAKVSMLRLKHILRGAAAMGGRTNVLMRLLRLPGIQVDSQNCSGNTPLIYAAGCHGVPRNNLFQQGGHQHEILFNSIIKALLDHGANVNTRNLDGHSPISQAASHGYLEIVKTLLAHGASVDVIDEAGVTPLLSAVRGRHVGIVEELLKKVDKRIIDHQDRYGFTALGHAARIGHDGLVCLLLRADAKFDFNKSERNPLSLAARGGHEQVVKSLLLHGADAGYQSRRLTTPLHLAVIRGHKGVLTALLDKCSTHSAVNARNSEDRTPLIYAAMLGHREILRTLLDRGADVNARDRKGRSALSYAACGGHYAITKILLKHKGIEVNRQDNHTNTPFWYAVRWGHVKVLRELIDSCPHVEPFLVLARKYDHHKNITYLFAVQLRREVEFEHLCNELSYEGSKMG